jgi:hypothetical protein
MAQIKYSNQILNQKGNPAWYEDILSARPAAGYTGRMFIATDTFAFYRDNGASWDLVGGAGTGTITGTGVNGQLALWGGTSALTGSAGILYNSGTNKLTTSGYIISGGISTQFLKADGSVDSTTYIGSGAIGTTVQGYNVNTTIQGNTVTGTGSIVLNSSPTLITPSFTSVSVTGGTATMPTGNGTIAYTSALASYVPYTGASSSVTLGSNNITANSFIKGGGTSVQFLKADGSVDSSTYVTSTSLSSYLPLIGGTLTGALTGTTANFTGLTLNGAISGNLTINTTNATASTSITTGSIVTSGGIGVTGAVWGGSFVKNGGTSVQFLKADGSVDSSTYLTTAAASTTYVPYTGATGAVNLGTNTFSSGRMASAGTSITGVATQTNISAFTSTGGMIINGSIGNVSQDGITYQSGGGGGAAIVFKRGGSFDTYMDFYVNNSNTTLGSIDTKWLAVDKTGAATFSSSITQSASDSRLLGGDAAGRYVISNSNTTSYIGIYGASNATPYQISFVTNSATALTLASTGAATFSNAILQSVGTNNFNTTSGSTLIGTSTDNGQAILQVNGGVTMSALSASGQVYASTATLSKLYYHVFTGAAAQTLTMLSPLSNNYQYVIINNTAVTVTIAAAASTNIITLSNTSVASIVLAANARAIFIADGNNKYYQIL